jgi:uncharacterized protein (DUF924 family)
MSKVNQILQFWFGSLSSESYLQFQPWWFQANPMVDQQLQDLFAADYQFAAAGYLARLVTELFSFNFVVRPTAPQSF